MRRSKKKTKKIYIVLSYTGTILSKIIKGYTKAEYCHVSLSLDKKLKHMYSFGRLNPYNPFFGGFVHEGVDTGTFKRFKKTAAEIYSLEVTEEQFKLIKKKIREMKKNKEIYKFNTIGLFASGFNIKYKRDGSFYCAEFVKYLIDEAKVELDLPELVKPIDFRDSNLMNLEYRGLLKKFRLD